ncbi:MAG: MarR family transcriptional regulator [Actinomycetia bacterium]|nr:MarR family transcriptional regulator [Actinomycetes bacterium]
MTTTIPFGPQLVGETEKTLNALLRVALQGTGLTEAQWVALRVAALTGGSTSAEELALVVGDRAHFADAAELVRALDERGLIADGHVTAAGHETLESVLARSAALTGPIWEGFAPADLEAATLVLNELRTRARAVLGSAAVS